MAAAHLSRRQWLKRSASFAVPMLVPSQVLGRNGTPPSERIHFGVVGLGGRGLYLLMDLLRREDVVIRGLCDVHKLHHRDNPWGQGPRMGREGGRQLLERARGEQLGAELLVTDDYRVLCEDDQVDAILVATPDHWHALVTLHAIRAGKDVYCEKPVTHTFAEGQQVCREVDRVQAVFQTGSQQRSDPLFQQAVQLVRHGYLGPIKRIEVGLPPGYDAPQGDSTVGRPPAGLDYEFWCGPAPRLPYMRARHHRWWRGHRAFGGGVLMDWIGHHNDIAHWSMGWDQTGPQQVEAVGWKHPATSVYDTPQHYEIRCRYAGGVETSIASRHALGTKWIGDDGWLYVNRGKLEAADPRLLEPQVVAKHEKLTSSTDHVQDFLQAMRTRGTCVAPPRTAHRSITPGHLAYVSHAVRQPLTWDPQREQITDHPEAQALLLRNSYRAPWSLKVDRG